MQSKPVAFVDGELSEKVLNQIMLKPKKGNSFVTNPITWKTDNEYAARKMNKGSVLFKFNKVYERTTDAHINEGVIWVNKPKFPWSFLYSAKNYHVGDINLYYMNMRENIGQRIENYSHLHSAK